MIWTALPRTAPLGPGESATSFVSRVAAANWRSARAFLADRPLPFQRVLDGCAATLAAIAVIGSADPVELIKNALVRDRHGFQLRGERLSRPSLKRERIHVCPICLLSDTCSYAPPEMAVFGRAVWQLASLRACPVHCVALVEIAHGVGPADHIEFSGLVGGSLATLPRLVDEAKPLAASAFEQYLMGRLESASGQGGLFLDSLELHAALKTCGIFGAVAEFGRTHSLKTLNDGEWRRAEAVGFEICRVGEEKIRSFLESLQQTLPAPQDARAGPKAMFGRIYEWLSTGAEHPAYDPVRTLLFTHITETMPFGAGEAVLGRSVERRSVHSLWTASKQHGLHPKRLSTVLVTRGLLSEADIAGKSPNLVFFDARAADEILLRASDLLSLAGAGDRLNIGLVQARALFKSGVLKPFLREADRNGRKPFARADLDQFMLDLSATAQGVDSPPPNCFSIFSAAKRANCAGAEIVRLIEARELEWVGRDRSRSGLPAILVRLDEIKTRVRGEEIDGIPVWRLWRELHTTDRAVVDLLAARILTRQRATNPVNRCPQSVVSKDDLAKFQAEFVSLKELSIVLGIGSKYIVQRLSKHGIEPALPLNEVRGRFYRRAEIPPRPVAGASSPRAW